MRDLLSARACTPIEGRYAISRGLCV